MIRLIVILKYTVKLYAITPRSNFKTRVEVLSNISI
jgi:hypothetical protein